MLITHIFLGFLSLTLYQGKSTYKGYSTLLTNNNGNFKIYSNSFNNGKEIDIKYTAYGSNISPHLKWENAPEGTKSFALIVEDPDAAKVVGYTYIHWILKNIPKDITSLQENEFKGEQIKNHANLISYFGPKPPKGSGIHHYYFKIFALSVSKIDSNDRNQVISLIKNNMIGSAEIMGTFEYSEEQLR